MTALHSTLVDLFTSALATGAQVRISEQDCPGANGVLRAWAATLDLAVKEHTYRRLSWVCVSHARCEISVVVKERAEKREGARQ